MDEVNSFYSPEDLGLMSEALREPKPWDAKYLEGLKRRIYEHHRKRQHSLCCYCQRDQYGEFKFVIDIEHILPKEKFRSHMFELWNLSVSCKRCNMQIKGQRVDFLRDASFTSLLKDDPKAYKFIHPNLDPLHLHLIRQSVQSGQRRIVKYVIAKGSNKGRYTYKYFRLNELEIDSFDAAQNPISEDTPSATLDAFRTLVNQLRDSK